MSRARLFFLLFLLISFVQGCSAFRQTEGRTSPESKMSKKELWNELQRQKITNQELQGQLHREIEKGKKMQAETDSLKKEMEQTRSERLALESKLSGLEQEKETLNKKITENEQQRHLLSIKIKVLSGDGTFRSARHMSTRMEKWGYKVGTIGLAPKPNFTKDTVFFTPNFKKEADRLTELLGAGTVSKPLTWDSMFDLIVVTGKQQP